MKYREVTKPRKVMICIEEAEINNGPNYGGTQFSIQLEGGC